VTGRSTREPDEAPRLLLEPSPTSPGRARRLIRERAAAWSLPEELAERLVLVGSELVTNAALHARTPLTLVLELRRDGVRISVQDRSRAPVAQRHYHPDALTGRGLAVVGALSRSWGVRPTADGKVIWAELALDGAAPSAAPPQPPPVPPPPPPGGPGLRTVRFAGVPVEAYLELQEHNDALFRELELISIELAATDGAAPPTSSRLAGLVDRLYRQFRSQRDGHRETVAAALARGERTVELQASASPAAVPAARAYVELLEEADELCRTDELLTPPPSAQVRSLRRWFVDQMAAQLQDEAPAG
jgi:anti-sigma regulatory factor (Ser/Thr protein kinase)